jgi:hypothetical protein
MEKDYLILRHASASRPSSQWNDDDFDVLADGAVALSAVARAPKRDFRTQQGANTRSSELPVQSPVKFELVINLRIADLRLII